MHLTKEYVKQNVNVFIQLIKGWEYADWKEENFLYDLDKKWDYSIGCFIDEQLVGFCFSSAKIEGAYYIHYLYVSGQYRQKNIGKEMMDYVKKYSYTQRLDKVVLRCPVANERALDFYLKNKFQILEKEITSDSSEPHYLLFFNVSNE